MLEPYIKFREEDNRKVHAPKDIEMAKEQLEDRVFLRDLYISVTRAISRSLKTLAKELNVPIIALSQLNRSLEARSKVLIQRITEVCS